jgi:PIN domain nuclease of toxin-antitoxin system
MPTRSLPPRPLLLDTHVWIWVMDGMTRELGRNAVDAVARAGAGGRVLVSAISVWEVAVLEAKGRVRFALDVAEWVRRALNAPGVRLAELTPEIAVDSARLSADVHGDPADRILIATARRAGATLVTRDPKIVDYGRQGLLSVLDAAP